MSSGAANKRQLFEMFAIPARVGARHRIPVQRMGVEICAFYRRPPVLNHSRRVQGARQTCTRKTCQLWLPLRACQQLRGKFAEKSTSAPVPLCGYFSSYHDTSKINHVLDFAACPVSRGRGAGLLAMPVATVIADPCNWPESPRAPTARHPPEMLREAMTRPSTGSSEPGPRRCQEFPCSCGTTLLSLLAQRRS